MDELTDRLVSAAIPFRMIARAAGDDAPGLTSEMIALQHVRTAAILMREAAEEIEDLKSRLALADAAFMEQIGCFPLDRANDRQRLLNDTCKVIRQITGDDYRVRFERAAAYRQAWLAAQETINTSGGLT